MEASAKPEKPVFADITAQRYQADDSEEDVEQSAMRSPDVGFTALRTLDSHGQQSPKNLRLCEVGIQWRLSPIQTSNIVQSQGLRAALEDTTMMLPARRFRNSAG